MMPGCPLRAVPHGYQFLSGAQQLGRHRHPEAYAALVVSGSYLEAGDSGRRVVGAGGVVFHRPWEAHLNRVGSQGSRILNLRMASLRAVPPFGELSDPDAIVRLAEGDPSAAAGALLDQVRPIAPSFLDWPDLLAESIRGDPNLSIQEWAACHKLSATAVSRGFRSAFGMSPKRFRLDIRTVQALERLNATDASIIEVAASTGFADQAHMTRAITTLTGRSPGRWRAWVKSVQDMT